MTRAPIFLAIAALALPLAQGGCAPEGAGDDPGGQIVGAYKPADAHEDDVVAAARFAATAASKGKATLLSIDDAQRQVVAGTNYRMTLTLSDASRWETTVWRKLDGAMELSASRQLPPLVQPDMRVDAQGIRLTADGKDTMLPFGMAQADVMKALSFRGPARQSTNEDCGEGPVEFAQWPDGFSLLSQRGRFGGWGLSGKGGAVQTMDALRIGSSLAQVRVAGKEEVAETSLGREFSVNGIHGVVEGEGENARVTALWSGELSCVFR